MALVGQIGRLLGPRGLMPNAKTGSVTFDVTKAVNELKAGRVDFKVDKAGVLHAPLGKVSFGPEKILGNLKALLETVNRLKRQGHLHALHGGVHDHGPRLQDRHVPGEKIPGRLSPFFS